MFEDEMLTIDEVAEYLKLKPQTIYKWAQTGQLPGAKFGKEWRFRRSHIEKWIDERIADSKASGSRNDAGTSKSRPASKSSSRASSRASPAQSSSSDGRLPPGDSGPVKN